MHGFFFRKLWLLAICLYPLLLKAQTPSYHVLRSEGKVPADFFPYSDVTANRTGQSLPTRNDRKIFDDYSLSSNYYVYNFLVNGYVLYGTSLNQYIDKVADVLLKDDPELRSKIRIYIVESSEIQAVTFPNGVICVNVGLLANLKNEAQLAFILSHEIIHYQKSHSFKTYSRRKTADRKTRKMYKEDHEKTRLHETRFSREHEIEADSLGYFLFVKSGYRLSEAATSFNMLARWAFPFDSIPLKKDFVDSRYLKVPSKYFIDTAVNVLHEDLKEHDSLETHPALPKRRKMMEQLTGTEANKGLLFQVSEEEFKKVKKVAQYELSRLYLSEGQYQKSIYNTYLLLNRKNSYTEELYLNSCMVKALYYIQKNANGGRKTAAVENKDKSKGEVSRLNLMIHNMRKDELNTWCLRMAWDIHKKYPDNQEILVFTKEITKGFKANIAEQLTYFYPLNRYNDSLIQSFYTVTDNERYEASVKGNKGRKTNKIRQVARETYAKYSMPDYIDDAEFSLVFSQTEFVSEKNDAEETDQELQKDEQEKRSKKRNHKKVKQFDVQNIIIADLTDIKLDQRKDDPVMYTALKKHTNQLIGNIGYCAGRAGLNVKMYIPEKLTENDSIEYSEHALIKKYINERAEYENWKEYYPVDYTELCALAKRNNTRYIGYMYNAGIVLKKNHLSNAVQLLLGALIYPPIAVVLAYDAFSPERHSFLVFKLIDVETGKEVYSFNQYYNSDSRQDLLKAELYYIFLSAKNQ